MHPHGAHPSIDALEASFTPANDRDLTSAIQHLRDDWPALVAEDGSRIRELLDGLPSERWESDPWLVTAYAASFRSVGSLSRSAALPYFAAAISYITDATPPGIRIAIGLHHSAALRGLGRLDEALQSATDAGRQVDEDPTLPLAARISLGSRASLQKGIAHLHLGDYDNALAELRIAAGLAGTHLFASEQLECFGAIALTHYTFGDFERVAHFVALAKENAPSPALAESQFGAAALIVEQIICVEQDRLAEAEALSVRVGLASVRSDWEPLGWYSRAAISILNEHYVEVLDILRRCLHSYSSWTPPGAIVTASEGLRAVILLRLGEAESAWDIFGSLTPTQHHSHCPGRFLAHMRFTTGDTHGALEALRDCEALGDSHSSRTLIDVLLVKAAATHQLTNFTISDISFDRALILSTNNSMIMPFRLVPSTVMRAMIARAESRPQPDAARVTLETVKQSGTVLGGMNAALLSERERDIVRAFTRDLSVAEIADSLFISVNTVKTHLKSIYRKLGVGSRSDAIKRARALGLHVEITQGSPPNHPR